MSILSKQRIHVTSEYDQVILMVGDLDVNMPYAISFRVAQGLRLAAKDAMRYAKEDVTNWAAFANEDMPERTTPYVVSKERRITVQKGFSWRAGWNGENVKIQFGNNELQFHFTTALQISTWLHNSGAEAKAWAGDTGKSMFASAILSNAEENYRLGI